MFQYFSWSSWQKLYKEKTFAKSNWIFICLYVWCQRVISPCLMNGWIRADSYYIFLNLHNNSFQRKFFWRKKISFLFVLMHDVKEMKWSVSHDNESRANSSYIFLDLHDKSILKIPLLTKLGFIFICFYTWYYEIICLYLMNGWIRMHISSIFIRPHCQRFPTITHLLKSWIESWICSPVIFNEGRKF